MFFSEKKLHLSEKQLEEFTACARESAQTLQNTLASKSAFYKSGGNFKANPCSSNCLGMGRRDISQHIPIANEARTAGPATGCAFTLVTLGAIPLPFGKWRLNKIWNLENGLDAAPGTCSGSWSCSSLVQNHSGSRALSELGLSLQDTVNTRTDIYIYIYLSIYISVAH